MIYSSWDIEQNILKFVILGNYRTWYWYSIFNLQKTFFRFFATDNIEIFCFATDKQTNNKFFSNIHGSDWITFTL